MFSDDLLDSRFDLSEYTDYETKGGCKMATILGSSVVCVGEKS